MKERTKDSQADFVKYETKSNFPEMCECQRLYVSARKDGKLMCTACYLNCDVETLKKLWGMPNENN